jgi:UDP-N-acetylmuramyl pentapeptide phosphotransferase/UDP-N-acetylglucosamine-1-phosphate transferase
MFVEYLIKLAAMGFAASFCMSLLILFSQRWHGKHSNDHDLNGVQKVHTTAVPRVGGIAVLVGIIVGLCLFNQVWPEALTSKRMVRLAALIAVAAPAFIAGIIEDITKKVSVKVRLAATILSALLASFALSATITEIDIWGFDLLLMFTPFAVCVTALIVAGGANAINIIDGFNGLSSSTLILMAGGLGFVAWESNDQFVMLLSALCIGATLGFLVFNYPFGKLFLGDGGAYFLGFWVAEMAVLLVRHPEINAWKVLGICGYPVIEVMFSIYRRKFIKKVSPGAADALHLHTLIYRRVVFAAVPWNAARPWQRNAAVSLYIVPVVACSIIASALFGDHVPAAVGLVLVQLFVYVLAYRRLVHGRWTVPSMFLLGGEQESAHQQ